MSASLFVFSIFYLLFALLPSSSATLGASWRKLTPSGNGPVNITSGAAGTNGASVFFITGQIELWNPSGGSEVSFPDTVYEYKIATNTYSRLTISGVKPAPRAYPAFCTSRRDDAIYFFGGATFDANFGDLVIFADLWKFNMSTKKFTKLNPSGTNAPSGVVSAVMSRIDDYLYLFGGVGENGYTNDFWKFNLKTNVWTQITSPGPSARQAMQHHRAGKSFYINGGEGLNLDTFEFTNPNDTWVFDTTTSKWKDITPPANHNIPPKTFSASFSFLGLWAIYGGETAYGNQIDGCGAPFPQNPAKDLWIKSPLLGLLIRSPWTEIHPGGQAPPPLKRPFGVQISATTAYLFSGFNFVCPSQTTPGFPGQIYNKNIYVLSI